jgi:hypothetical protein
MNPTDLLSIVFARSDQVLWLWCFHAAVCFGLIAFATVPAVRGDRRLRRLLLGGFAFYAFTHLEAMMWVVKQWAVASDLLHGQPGFELDVIPPRFPTRAVTIAPEPVWIVPFHIEFDAFALFAIWTAARPRPS